MLTSHEFDDELFYDGNAGWYETLFKHCDINSTDYKRQNLSVITYNYDRSLEHCFRKIIEARYGHDELRAQEIWGRRPEIVHLHGILGHYDPLDDQHRPYAPPPDAKSLFRAASAIQIISDADPSTPDFVRARELLDGAVRIIFLGFGFDIKNVLRLRVFEEKVNCDKVDSTYRLHGHRDRRWVIETVFDSQIDQSALKNIPIDTYMDEHF